MMKLKTMYGLPAMRVAFLALCTAAMGATTMMAQDTPPASGQGRGGMATPEQQQRQMDMMTKQLNLTPDQVTQIKAIQDDTRKQSAAMRDDTTTSGDDRRTKMMAMRTAEQTKIKAILTEDQKPKYDAMIAQQRQARGNGGGGYGGGNGNGGPPPSAPPSAN